MNHQRHGNYSIMNDLLFRVIFGSEHSTDSLRELINVVHRDATQVEISDVTIMNPINLSQFRGDKESTIDIRAVADDGRRFTIEVQLLDKQDFARRSLYYWAKTYVSQLGTGSQYS